MESSLGKYSAQDDDQPSCDAHTMKLICQCKLPHKNMLENRISMRVNIQPTLIQNLKCKRDFNRGPKPKPFNTASEGRMIYMKGKTNKLEFMEFFRDRMKTM